MNNKNMKQIYKLVTVGLLTSVLGVYTQCIPETSKIDAQEGYRAPSSNNGPKDEGEILQALEVSVGVKNYEELNVTYEVLTGVSASTPAVRDAYNEMKVSLPTDSEMKSYLSGHQVAAARLAAEYCNAMVNDQTLRQRIWTNANYAMTLNNAFNQTRMDELSTKLMDVFWGPAAGQSEKDEMRLVLNDLMADLMVGEANTQALTSTVVKSLCTAVLSSMHVIAK
jgi:hypothetical protein